MRQLLILCALLPALTASAQQTNQVTLLWNPNTETNLAGYVVSYGTNVGFSSNAQALVSSPLLTSTNYTFTNLMWSRVYSFAVRAVDTDGVSSDPSEEVMWRSVRPAKPSGLKRSISVTVNVTVNP